MKKAKSTSASVSHSLILISLSGVWMISIAWSLVLGLGSLIAVA